MNYHNLKTHPAPFQAILDGRKTFEFRKNDREFQIGDRLNLREFEPRSRFGGEEDCYSGRECVVEVGYILDAAEYGVPEGYCVMSIRPAWSP